MSLQPSFAEKWVTSPDGLKWTFDTVKGAKWSDGESLTAKDAAFTLNVIRKFQDGVAGKLAGFMQE